MKTTFKIRLLKKSVDTNSKTRSGKTTYGYVEYMECEDDASVVFEMKKRFTFSSFLDFKEKGLEQGINCAKILFEKLGIYANFIVVNEFEFMEDCVIYEFAVVESSKFFTTKHREDNQDY